MAVTGRRSEIFVPAAVYNEIGGRGTLGLCFSNGDALLRMLQFRAARATSKSSSAQTIAQLYGRKPKRDTAKGKAVSIEKAVEDLKADLERLRKTGIVGDIPVCAYPTTGKGAETERIVRRTTAIHERFHSNFRDAERRNGIATGSQGFTGSRDCVGESLRQILEDRFGKLAKDALEIGETGGWASRKRQIPEELLARIEESRQSCNRSAEDCDDANRDLAINILNQNFKTRRRDPSAPIMDVCTLIDLTDRVTKEFGGAQAVANEAIRACMPRGAKFKSAKGEK